MSKAEKRIGESYDKKSQKNEIYCPCFQLGKNWV